MRATLGTERGTRRGKAGHEGGTQTARREDVVVDGKAPLDMSALKPYRGKPALRNFRGDDGDVGIIRSPVRAIALPGEQETEKCQTGLRRALRKQRLRMPPGDYRYCACSRLYSLTR